MREIKFRAIYLPDGKTKDGYLMFEQYEDEEQGLSFRMIRDKEICYPISVVYYDKNWILLQYIGLKDRTGHEIYEGDIVQDNQYKFEVKIKDGLLMPFYEVEHADDGGVDLWCDHKWEIIGNIYENKELFNDKE